MPHALFLSPDDQAVSAITGVLEELSVTWERPLDGTSAAQKINSGSFDLVLVDCENLAAAKLILEVCGGGRNGHHPVPIAIVDGSAGLPTAFRMGAELILTKPVAKDQARTTIRNAVGRMRKEPTAHEAILAPVAGDPRLPENAPAPAPMKPAAAVAAPSSRTPLPLTGASAAAAVAPALSAKTTAVSEPVAALDPPTAATLEARGMSANAKAARAAKFSDIAVLAELRPSKPAPSEPDTREVETHAPKLARTAQSAASAQRAQPSTKKQSPAQARGALVALLAFALAGAACYGGYQYVPGFRALLEPVLQDVPPMAESTMALVRPRIRQVLALAGIAQAEPALPVAPARTASKAVVPTTPVPVAATAGAARIEAPSTPAAALRAAAANQPRPNPTPTIAPLADPATTRPATPTALNHPAIKSTEKGNEIAASGVPSPGEQGAMVILSSKGAEKRLARSVAPQFPAEVAARPGEGKIVLHEVVDATGKVAAVRLVEGDPKLGRSAVEAVRQWQYKPYVREGKTLPFQTLVIFEFPQRP